MLKGIRRSWSQTAPTRRLARCRPYLVYVSLDAPDRETYLRLCRPREDYWDLVQESLAGLAGRRSAIRTTVVRGYNDFCARAVCGDLPGLRSPLRGSKGLYVPGIQ